MSPLLWGLDFNVDPMSSAIVQKKHDVVSVIDEIVLARASTMEACEEFQSRYPSTTRPGWWFSETRQGTDANHRRERLHDGQRFLLQARLQNRAIPGAGE